MSITIFALSAILQQANRLVDFTPPAARMVNLAGPLSTCLGKEVTVSENLRDEVVAVYAPRVRVASLMESLATSLDAEWQERDGRLTLQRTKAGELLRSQREIKFRTARIRTRQKEMLAELDRQGEFSEQNARLVGELVAEMARKDGFYNGNDTERLGRKTPLGRFLIRVIASIPAEEIAAIPFARRLVYSLKPTSMQRKLQLTPSTLAALRRENEIYTQATRALGLNPNAQDAPPYLFPQSLPDQLEVDLRFASSGVGVNVVGSLVSQGNQLCRTYVEIQPYVPMPAPGKDAEVPLELSPLALEFREVYRAGRQGKPQALSTELKAFMGRPDVTDPLGFVGGPAAKALSQSERKPAIYLVPDGAFFPLLGIMRGSTPTLGMLRVLLADEEQFETSGFLVVRPKEPVTQRAETCDRVALAEWLSKFAKKGPNCDDTMKLFAAHYESPGVFSVLWATSLFPQRVPREASRVFGLLPNLMTALTKNEREHLASGGSITYARLSSQAKSVTDQMVFGLNSYLRERIPGNRNGTEVEPTTVLPIGIPPSATLTAKRSVSSVVVGVRDQAGLGLAGLVERGARDLGFQISCQRRNVITPIAGWPKKLAIVERESWWADVVLGPGLSMRTEFINMFAPVSREVTLDSLPEAYQAYANAWADYYDKHPDEPAPMIREGAYGPPPNDRRLSLGEAGTYGEKRVQSPRYSTSSSSSTP